MVRSSVTGLDLHVVKHMYSTTVKQRTTVRLLYRWYQGGTPEVETEKDPLAYILLGIVVGLIVVLIVLITSLVCTRRK